MAEKTTILTRGDDLVFLLVAGSPLAGFIESRADLALYTFPVRNLTEGPDSNQGDLKQGSGGLLED